MMDPKILHFANVDRSTMITVVSVNDDEELLLLIFKGTNIIYRTVLRDGYERMETLAE